MKRKIILMLSAVMALASCSKDETTTITTPDGVSFELNGIRSRVSDGRFEVQDEIFVTAYNAGAFFKSTNYEYEGENTFISDYPFSYPGDTPLSLSYVATYPSKYNKLPSFNIAAATDQSTAENYEMSDVLVAKTDPTTSEKPSLTFYHVMSNLVIKMNVTNLSNEPIEYTDVKFKAAVSQDCDIDAESYAMSSGAEAVYVSPLKLSEERYSMVLASDQTLYIEGDFGSVMIDGVEYNMPENTGADVTLKSGYMDKYTWTLQIDGGTVVKNKIEKIAGSLNDWDYDGTGGGDNPGGDVTPTPTPSGENLLSKAGIDTSFENAATGGFIDLWWGGTFAAEKYTLTNSSAGQAHTGTKSTYISITEGGGCAVAYRQSNGTMFSITGVSNGTYTLSFWVYVTEFQVKGDLTPGIGFEYRMEDMSHTANFDAPAANNWIGADFAKNTWTQLSVEITVDTPSMDEIILRAVNNGTGNFTFYLDDISLVAKGSGGDSGDVTPTPTPSDDNMLETAGWDVGAETADPGWKNFALWVSGGVSANGVIENNTTAQAHGGTKSTKITAPANGWFVGSYRSGGMNTQILVPVTSGTTYTIGAWFYFTSIPATPNLSVAIGTGAASQVYGSLTVTSDDLNKWVYKSVDVEAKATENCEVIFQALNIANSTEFAFYIDDVTMAAKGGSSTGGGTVTPTPTPSGDDLLSATGFDTSFEDASKGSFVDLWWGGTFGTEKYTLTNNSADKAHTGTKSTYISVTEGGGCAVAFRQSNGTMYSVSGLTAGTYTVNFWVYVTGFQVNGTSTPAIGFEYRMEDTSHAANFDKAGVNYWIGEDFAKNTWTQLSVEITVDTTSMDELILRAVNNGTGNFTFYLDDISLTKK